MSLEAEIKQTGEDGKWRNQREHDNVMVWEVKAIIKFITEN